MPQPDRSVMPPKKTVEKSETGQEAVRLRYSPVEVLRHKDFALYSPEEFAELQRLLADLQALGGAQKEPAPGTRSARTPRPSPHAARRDADRW